MPFLQHLGSMVEYRYQEDWRENVPAVISCDRDTSIDLRIPKSASSFNPKINRGERAQLHN